MANCEQVGMWRHDGGIHGDIIARYNQTGIRSKKDNIFAAILSIGFKDKPNHPDKMTCLNNKMTMAGVLKK